MFSALRKLYHGALSVLIIVAFPAVRYSLFVCVSICLYFPLLTAARLVKHAVAMPQIRTGLPLPSGRGISFGLFILYINVTPTNMSPLQGSTECWFLYLQICHPAGVIIINGHTHSQISGI